MHKFIYLSNDPVVSDEFYLGWFSGHGSVDDMLDAENKRIAENLASKVSRLKSVRHNQQF